MRNLRIWVSHFDCSKVRLESAAFEDFFKKNNERLVPKSQTDKKIILICANKNHINIYIIITITFAIVQWSSISNWTPEGFCAVSSLSKIWIVNGGTEYWSSAPFPISNCNYSTNGVLLIFILFFFRGVNYSLHQFYPPHQN
jgi:hypothetical protein